VSVDFNYPQGDDYLILRHDRIQKVSVIFVCCSAILLSLLVYSSYLYFNVYAFTTNFDVAIKSILLNDFNTTHVYVNLKLLLRNPSMFTVNVTYIKVNLALNGKLICTMKRFSYYNPIIIHSFSNLTLNFSRFCSKKLVEIKDSAVWRANILIVIKGLPISSSVTITRIAEVANQ